MSDTEKVRGYLKAEVSIHCVRDETVGRALERLRSAVEAYFGSEYDSDVEVEAVESAGLAFDAGTDG
jgi:hypothetical protein